MVTATPGKLLADDEFQELRNLIFRDGFWRKRPGLEPLYNSGAGGGVAGPVIGLFRHYRSNGDKYSIAIDVDNNSMLARLLAKKNDAIGTTNWTLVDATFLSYEFINPDMFRAAPFGDKLILTDGETDVKYFDEYKGTTWLKGRLGAFAPKRLPALFDNRVIAVGPHPCAEWEGNPIFPGGFAQYCYTYVYEDEEGKYSYSDPSPMSAIAALDWMGQGVNGIKDFVGGGGGIDQYMPGRGEVIQLIDVGPTRVRITDLGLGKEFMLSATDVDAVRRIIRRDVYRRIKRFADEEFGSWLKVGEANIKEGTGGEGFVDQSHTPVSTPLKTGNYPPPRAKCILSHKNCLLLGNYKENVIEAPALQSDVTYPYYGNYGLKNRVRIMIVNRTQRGFTDAVIRFRLQWHDTTGADYIAFVQTNPNAHRNIVFTASDEKTLLPYYRESYKLSGYLMYSNLAGGAFAVGNLILGSVTFAEAIITKITVLTGTTGKLWIEKMANASFTAADAISVGGVTADVDSVQFNEMIVVVRVPEIASEGDATIYAYYNADTTLVTDPVSAWYNVYHRKYASGDMLHLLGFDNDYPMGVRSYEGGAQIPIDRIKMNIVTGRKIGYSVGFCAPYANEISFNEYSQEGRIVFADDYSHLSITDPIYNVNQGTVQFFVRPSLFNNDGLIVLGSLRVWYEDATSELHILCGSPLEDMFSFCLPINMSVNQWYFISIGWCASGGRLPYVYARELGSNIGSESKASPGNTSKRLDGPGDLCVITIGNVDVAAYNHRALWGMYDELVIYAKLKSLEEVEQDFHRRDLDSWFYDVENSRATPGDWNSEDATCNIKTFEAEDIGGDQEQYQAGLAISDSGNADVYRSKNRRPAIGESSDAMNGLIEYMGNVLVYKRRSVYRLQTDGPVAQWMEDDAPIDEARHIGLVAPFSLCHGSIGGQDAVIGLSDDGVYAFQAGRGFMELSQCIRDQFRALTEVKKRTAIGFYWQDYRVYVLGIGSTARTGGWTDWTSIIGNNIVDTLYFFHLDTLRVTQLENGEQQVKVNISKITTLQTGDKFHLGYPCVWNGKGDNGEVLFAHGENPYIYVWGERTGNSEYLDYWATAELNIPIKIKTRQFWHRSAWFRAFKPYYKAKKIVATVMTWVNNVLSAIPKSYDELKFDNATVGETTHATQTALISGGHDGGMMYLLPDTARGEWLELEFNEVACEGNFIWEGMEYEWADMVKQ